MFHRNIMTINAAPINHPHDEYSLLINGWYHLSSNDLFNQSTFLHMTNHQLFSFNQLIILLIKSWSNAYFNNSPLNVSMFAKLNKWSTQNIQTILLIFSITDMSLSNHELQTNQILASSFWGSNPRLPAMLALCQLS